MKWIKFLQSPFPLGFNDNIYHESNISKMPDFDVFSSPEPKASRWAISIPVLRLPSSILPSTFSNIFFSETTGPIELKFHMETS